MLLLYMSVCVWLLLATWCLFSFQAALFVDCKGLYSTSHSFSFCLLSMRLLITTFHSANNTVYWPFSYDDKLRLNTHRHFGIPFDSILHYLKERFNKQHKTVRPFRNRKNVLNRRRFESHRSTTFHFNHIIAHMDWLLINIFMRSVLCEQFFLNYNNTIDHNKNSRKK